MPSTGQIDMPCNPSLPPVSQCARFAASKASRPRPSVIMISVKWRKREMMKLTAKPTSPAAAVASTSPLSGSPQPNFEINPAV